jgi:tRNA(Ile)-lysidine synthase
VATHRIAVAVSGGRDSTALWHATVRAAAAAGGLQVIGLHVHHGLQPQADQWLAHLKRQARRWASRGLPVSLHWQRLQGLPSTGQSVEAWARRERYAALTQMARDLDTQIVLLAHHRRDQAETFLLQALRGAGPAGLSAMPGEALRFGIIWARPWLEQPREAIDAYLRRHRLSSIDDLSNADTRWARNRLRHQVLPALRQGFVHAESSLAASARRAQEAAACLHELAQLDLMHSTSDDGSLLRVAAWVGLSGARRANLLRAWLARWTTDGVAETLVQRLLRELPAAHRGSWPMAAGQLRLHAGLLGFHLPSNAALRPDGPPIAIDLSHEGRIAVPQWHGAFEVSAVTDGGMPPERLRHGELRARDGGERFQQSPASPPRSLKKQFQTAGVPAWARNGPLLYTLGELSYVPGLGIDARRLGTPGSKLLALRWLATPAVGR